MTGIIVFSTANPLGGVRKETRDAQKIRDDVNYAKLGGVVKNLEEPDRRLILCPKHMGSCLTVWGTTVPGAATKEFSDFCAHIIMLPLLTLKKCDR